MQLGHLSEVLNKTAAWTIPGFQKESHLHVCSGREPRSAGRMLTLAHDQGLGLQWPTDAGGLPKEKTTGSLRESQCLWRGLAMCTPGVTGTRRPRQGCVREHRQQNCF